ncbi:hypothetical protein LCGC14_1018640, partial [marine sediment metagenome]
MKRVCCVCKKVFGHKAGTGETHGFCKACFKAAQRNLARMLQPWRQEIRQEREK